MRSLLKKPFMWDDEDYPEVDLAGCVLYLPAWQTDMIARGGDISNGTGVMSGLTTQILPVGSTTITATGAGTFIVRMPEGGTVTSGTATITGSPVTISAGIATTVTTGVTTGNFVCAVSNIVRSKDKNNHACTISGMTWGATGRSSDIVDDYIKVADHTSLTNLTTSTYFGWVNPTTLGESNAGALIMKATANGAGYGVRLGANGVLFFTRNFSTGSPYRNAANSTVTLGAWQMLACTWAGTATATDIKFYKGTASGVAECSYGTGGDGSGTLVTDSGYDLYLGNSSDTSITFNGIQGAYAVYNRVFSLAELTRFWQATKWRYF